jgi:DNA-binding NtrC family response regulator
MSRILVVEDETVIRTALAKLLVRNGYAVEEAGSVTEAEENFTLEDFDLIISDLRLPGPPGTEIITRASGVPVLIMTSYASVRSAVDSMKMGAADYIAKPFDHDEMAMTVQRILEQHQLERRTEALQSDMDRNYPVAGMIGDCAEMTALRNRVMKVAPTDITVLVFGESGTGKELVARALHDQSQRSNAPLIAVNCAAIPEGLIESELFGHEKGAFTGAVDTRKGLVEAAHGGTLFLDEIGELSLPAQARLLRVLQEGEIRRVGASRDRKVDVRLIAATHRDLRLEVEEKRFREDLYFRLAVMEITLPPLRERGSDLAKLAEHFLQKSQLKLNRPPLRFAPNALAAIQNYRWPGNIRELENAIERAVILADSEEITAQMLAIEPSQQVPRSSTEAVTSDLSLEDYFRQYVLENQDAMTETALAKGLGISRKALWERRQRFGIPRAKSKS